MPWSVLGKKGCFRRCQERKDAFIIEGEDRKSAQKVLLYGARALDADKDDYAGREKEAKGHAEQAIKKEIQVCRTGFRELDGFNEFLIHWS